MEKHSTPKLNIFSVIGFACAVIFLIGFLRKNGVEISTGQAVASTTTIESVQQPTHQERTEFSIAPAEMVIRPTARRSETTQVAEKAVSKRTLNSWVNQFDEIAMSQAMDRGIPAGVSLAFGITKVRAGIQINTWDDYVEKVVHPLVHLKRNAPKADISNYFKYSANSELWAEGLGRTGRFDANDLKYIMESFNLDEFDRTVRANIVAGKQQPKLEQQAVEVANQVIIENTTDYYKADRELERAQRVSEWQETYNEVVGHEVAEEVARKKLKTGKYLTDEDLQRLVDETDAETEKALKNKVMFMGRKINKNHSTAAQKTDITNPKNAQARGELYQQKIQKKKKLRD